MARRRTLDCLRQLQEAEAALTVARNTLAAMGVDLAALAAAEELDPGFATAEPQQPAPAAEEASPRRRSRRFSREAPVLSAIAAAAEHWEGGSSPADDADPGQEQEGRAAAVRPAAVRRPAAPSAPAIRDEGSPAKGDGPRPMCLECGYEWNGGRGSPDGTQSWACKCAEGSRKRVTLTDADALKHDAVQGEDDHAQTPSKEINGLSSMNMPMRMRTSLVGGLAPLHYIVDQVVVNAIDESLNSRLLLTSEQVAEVARDATVAVSKMRSAAKMRPPIGRHHARGNAAKEQVSFDSDIIWQPVWRKIKVPLLHPEAHFKTAWMVLGSMFIVYEMCAIPVYMAFDVQPQGALYVFICCIDGYFVGDILVHFLSVYMDEHGDFVINPRQIALAYSRTWLVPDMIATIPWEWLSLAPSNGNGGDPQKMTRLLRTFRTLRLLRLVRVAKLLPIMYRLEARLESNHLYLFALGVLRIAGLLLVVCHWCACTWYAIGSSDYGDEYPNGAPASWVQYYQEDYPYIGDDKTHHYVYSLYYCLTTMATVGYGDITPKSFNEVRFAMVLLLMASIMFANLMSNLVQMVAALSARSKQLMEKKIALSQYLQFRGVPWKLRMSIRQHLLYQWDVNKGYDSYEEHLKAQLSPALRREVCHHIYGALLSSAPFLAWMKDFPTCTRFLSEKVHTMFLTPGDHICRMGQANDQIYMLLVGTVGVSRTEHLLEQDSDRGADFANTIPLSGMLAAAKLNAILSRRRGQDHEWKINKFDAEVLQGAKEELELDDYRRSVAVRTMQRLWRKRLTQRIENGEGPLMGRHRTSRQWLKLERMVRRIVNAPAYFGESCLWQPQEEWGKEPPPCHTYTARCEGRAELIFIPRDGIKEMLDRFSPWIPSRLELFQSVVQSKLQMMMHRDERFRQLLGDWSTVL